MPMTGVAKTHPSCRSGVSFKQRVWREPADAKRSCLARDAADRLDPIEQHAVVVSLIRRTGELPTEPLTDDELCGIADDLFASLDDEENGNNTEAR
jgi:hypothetical protein